MSRQPGEWHGPRDPPHTKPAYHRAFVAQDGRIWVQLHRESEPAGGPERPDHWREEATEFDVYDATGVYLGSVTGPPGLSPASMRGDTILAFDQDETGVDQVTRWIIRWGPG